MAAKCRKQKLMYEFWTSAIGKADIHIPSLKGGNVPWAEFSIAINNAVQPELRGDHFANNVSFARLIFAAR